MRGLKPDLRFEKIFDSGRTPPGVRGLKPTLFFVFESVPMSHPTRGAWIETYIGDDGDLFGMVAPHPGCVD